MSPRPSEKPRVIRKSIITLCVPSEYLDIVDEKAEEEGLCRSEMIRMIIGKFLEKEVRPIPGYQRIFTTNLFVSQIQKIKPLVGSQKRYFSRSELARIAIRDFCLDRMYEEKEIPLPDIQAIVRDAQLKYKANNGGLSLEGED